MVIQDIDSYIQEATQKLGDTNFLKKIVINPTLQHQN